MVPYPDFRVPYPDFRVSYPDFRVSPYPDFRVQYPDFRVWFYAKIFKITVTFSVLNLFVIWVDHLEEI